MIRENAICLCDGGIRLMVWPLALLAASNILTYSLGTPRLQSRSHIKPASYLAIAHAVDVILSLH